MLDEILVFHDCRFENEVRSVLQIPQRPIKTSEALKVTMLDCCFDSDELFDPEDYQTLQLFTNLKLLWIECREDSLPTIGRLINLEELHINCIGWNQTFDFRHLSRLQKLRNLSISGGDYSNMKLINLDALSVCSCLEQLYLHEFGYIDLKPLEYFQQLKELYIGYGRRVDNSEVIGCLKQLRVFSLTDE